MDERNYNFMFYGLAAAWTVIVLYVITLVGRQKKLNQELETLKKLVKDRSK